MRFPLLAGAAAASAAYIAYRSGYSTTAGGDAPTSPATASTPGTHKALIVDHSGIYTSVLSDPLPLSKSTDDQGRKILQMMTPDQVTAKLRTNQQSYMVNRGRGVVRYDVVQVPSNDPIEDDHAEKIIQVPGPSAAAAGGERDWMFWGIFDGHSGWTTSAKLRQALIPFVARELNDTYKQSASPTAETIDAAVRRGFVRLDDEITHDSVKTVMASNSRSLAAELLAPALSGSCALLSFYDSRSKQLRVACTGDSRAVLGRRSDADPSKWTATALSLDQTADEPGEVARLRAAHPDEPYAVHRGRVLGSLQPSRAFGDAVYKWSVETQEKLKARFFTRSPNKYLRTPPYVTAEPVVTTTEMRPERGDFVVLASDGLWEMLSNEEAVGLVGMWLAARGGSPLSSTNTAAAPAAGGKQSWLSSWFGSSNAAAQSTLPITTSPTSTPSDAEGRQPIRQEQLGTTSASRFVVHDGEENVATHLVRNALGGRDEDTLAALLTLPAPFSRRFRDDLTVQVVFFGEGAEGNGVVVNSAATAAQTGEAGGARGSL